MLAMSVGSLSLWRGISGFDLLFLINYHAEPEQIRLVEAVQIHRQQEAVRRIGDQRGEPHHQHTRRRGQTAAGTQKGGDSRAQNRNSAQSYSSQEICQNYAKLHPPASAAEFAACWSLLAHAGGPHISAQ